MVERRKRNFIYQDGTGNFEYLDNAVERRGSSPGDEVSGRKDLRIRLVHGWTTGLFEIFQAARSCFDTKFQVVTNLMIVSQNCTFLVMAKHTITLIPGDGIGPEIVAATVRVIEATGVDIEWETHILGAQAQEKYGTTLPESTIESIKRNKVALKGPQMTPIGKGFTSVNVGLRKALDLYANVRPIKALPNVPCRYPDLDLVVMRENTEDLYAGLEHVVVPGVVESLKIITEKASTRIAQYSFEFARANGRKKVTAVHKANIMKLSDGLFLECFYNVAKNFPELEADDKIIDNCCMQLVMRPEQFDVLVLENLYGDIVSDLCAGLIGGLGLAPGANIGEQGAVFEAVHGSAPDIAGQGIANPTAILMSGIMMLRHIGEDQAADRAQKAMLDVFAEGKALTKDLGGNAKTNEFARAIVEKLQATDAAAV
jgi:isocitrate dehydrogenase (NAD+)